MKYSLLFLLSFLLLTSSLKVARKANKAYQNGHYKEAIKLYKKAINKQPKNEKFYFNLASAQFKAGKQDEAIRTFEQYKSMTKNAKDKAKANYNIGNALAKKKKWGKAVDYYKKSLRHMAYDKDAKHNYELALKKEQEQKKKKKNKKNKKNKNNKQKKKNNKKKKNKNNKQQKKNKQKQKNKQQNSNKNKKGDNKRKQKAKARMSKAQAKKILKALEQKEKDLLKNLKKKKVVTGKKSKNEKDW